MIVSKLPLHKGAAHNSPKKIVIHSMSEFLKHGGYYIHAYTLLRKLGISAHRFIDPAGNMIISRDDTQGAYHAKGHNTDTLGVEFLVPGYHSYDEFLEAIKEPYITDKAFDTGIVLVKAWMNKWNIELDEVVTHSKIDPDRKFDPGAGFPLEDFLNNL